MVLFAYFVFRYMMSLFVVFFFFQAEDGIRDVAVTGVQTCALPIFAPIPEMLAAGCRVGIGADGAPCNNRLDAFAEMRLAALIQKPRLGPDALPAARALELATLGGARALGLESEIGSIEAGKCADLVVLDLDGPHAQPEDADLISRIVYSARAADVRHVIVDGRIVVRGGVLKTADTAEIRRKANVEARALRAKALDRL